MRPPNLGWLVPLLGRKVDSVTAFTSRLLRALRRHVPFDIACIALVEGDVNPVLVVRERAYRALPSPARQYGPLARQLPFAGAVPEEQRSFIAQVARTRRAQRTGDVTKENWYVEGKKKIRSELAAPVLLAGQVIAVINLESRERNRYSAGHQILLEKVARVIAPYLVNMMTGAAWRGAPASPQALRAPQGEIEKIFRSVPAGIPFEDSGALDEIARVIAQALQSERCEIRLLGDQDRLLIRGSHGAEHRGIPMHPDDLARALREAIELRSPSRFGPTSRALPVRAAGSAGPGISAPMMVAPMMWRSHPIGAVWLSRRYRGAHGLRDCYTPAEMTALEMLQARVTALIEMSRLELERRDTATRHSGALSLFWEIFSEPNLERALPVAARAIPRLCGGQYCSIFLKEPITGRFVLRASRGLEKEIGKDYYEPGEGLTGWVAKYGRPLLLDQRSRDYLQTIHPELRWKEKYREGGRKSRRDMRPFMAVPIFQGGEVVGVIRVTDRAAGVFTGTDLNQLSLVAAYIAANLPHAQKYEVWLNLQAPAVLASAMNALDAGIAPFTRVVLEQTAERAANALKTDILTLYHYRAETKTFDAPPIWKGVIRHQEFMNGDIHPGDAIWKILRDGSRFCPALPDELRAERATGASGPVARFPEREQIKSMAGIRLMFNNHPVGVMFLNYRHDVRFGEEQQQIITSFADHVAMMLEVAQIRDRAAKEQSDYLDHELHDGLQQHLNAMVGKRAGIALNWLESGNFEELKRELVRIEDAVQLCMDECNVLRGQLRSPVDRVGLHAALARVAAVFTRPGLSLRLEMPAEEPALPLRVKNGIYRVALAALTNAVTESRGRVVGVKLETISGLLCLTVQDDGVGFDVEAARRAPGAYGLRGIEKRVAEMGGTVEFQSAAGAGSCVVARIPIARETANEKEEGGDAQEGAGAVGD